MGIVRAEELRPACRFVAVGDVLDQTADDRIDSRFRVEVTMLDVAKKAAYGLSDVAAGQRELDADDAAFSHWASASTIPTRSRAATAARAASSCLRRSPSGRIEATISTACSAASSVAKSSGDSARRESVSAA